MGVCRPVHCILTLFMILEQDITLPRPFLDLPSKSFTRVRTLYLGQVRCQHTVLAFCYCRLVLFDIAYPCTCRGEGAATRRLYFTLNVPNHLKLKTLLVDSHDVLMVLLKTMSDISP